MNELIKTENESGTIPNSLSIIIIYFFVQTLGFTSQGRTAPNRKAVWYSELYLFQEKVRKTNFKEGRL